MSTIYTVQYSTLYCTSLKASSLCLQDEVKLVEVEPNIED